jgi:phage terminase Nu1 subunit (DNA packaging protein)
MSPEGEIVTPVTPPLEVAADKKVDEPKKDETNEVEFFKSKAKAMEKEAAAAAKKLAAYEKAEEERRQAELTDLQKAQEKAAKLEAELKAKDVSILRRDIAAKVGLPAVLADRLKGETLEEIEADATALLETLPKADQKKQSTINPTNPSNASQAETLEQKKARLGLTRTTDIYSTEFNTRKDGGVIDPYLE